MKSPEAHLKRWLDPFVFAAWTIFLIYLLISQRYVAFLRPEFGLLLALAHLIAMGCMLTAMVRSMEPETDNSAALRSLVLLVPILYSMAVPNPMLGNQAFKKRFTGNATGYLGRQERSGISSRGDDTRPDTMISELDVENVQPEKPQERTILELMLNPQLFNGQRVIVTGMMLHDTLLKPHFGGRQTAVYRFLMTCCAADALPLAIALDSDQIDAFTNDQWVQVDGVFKIQRIDGKPVPMVSEPRIRAIKAPAVPYLF